MTTAPKRPPQSRTGLTDTGVKKAADKSARTRAREFALQALYQYLVGGNQADAIDAFTRDLVGFHKADAVHFDALLHGCIEDAAALDAAIVGATQPDLTLIFDLPVEVGLQRAFGRGLFETRFESKGMAFHERLRRGFLDIAARYPERCVIIDADGDQDAVEGRVWSAVEARLL